MSDHKYTLDEIDRMRAALQRKYEPPRYQFPNGTMLPGDFFEKEAENRRHAMKVAEEELRTCMIGGIRPEELEARYPRSSVVAGKQQGAVHDRDSGGRQ